MDTSIRIDRRQLLLLAILTIALLAAIYWGGLGELLRSTGGRDIPPQNAPGVLDVDPPRMRAALQRAYRLKPDQRFLLALPEIAEFYRNDDNQQIAVAYAKEEWHVLFENHSVATLPELPSYEDLRTLIVEFARTQQRSQPRDGAPLTESDRAEIVAAIKEFTPRALFRAIATINRLGPDTRSKDLAGYAFQVLAELSIFHADVMEIDDRFEKHAIAALAIAAAEGEVPASAEVLLAHELGYVEAARKLASSLSGSDIVRAYVMHDEEAMKERSSQPDATWGERMLYAKALAARDSQDALELLNPNDYPNMELELSAWLGRVLLDLSDFNLNRAVGYLLSSTTMAELLVVADTNIISTMLDGYALSRTRGEEGRAKSVSEALFGPATAHLTERMERRAIAVGSQFDGELIPGDALTAYFRGLYWTGIYTEGLFLLDRLGSSEAAEDFLAGFEGSDHEVVKQFHDWYRQLIDAEAYKTDDFLLVRSVAGFDRLGATPRVRTAKQIRDKLGLQSGNTGLADATRNLAARLDSRPSQREAFYWQLAMANMDLPRAKNLRESLLRDARHDQGWLSVWDAYLRRDMPALKELLSDPELDLASKLRVVKLLAADEKAAPRFVRQAFEQIIADHPADWDPYTNYLDYLEDQKDYARGRKLAQRYILDHSHEARGLTLLLAKAKLARMYRYEGNYEQGWKTISPYLDSQHGSVFSEAARNAYFLGKKEQAYEIAKRAIQRYPGNLFTRLNLVEFLWRDGEPDSAAKLLAEFSNRISGWQWQSSVGEIFTRSFESRPTNEALEAFQALTKAGIPSYMLGNLTNAFTPIGKEQVALELLKVLHESNKIQDLQIRMKEYYLRRKIDGEKKASEWVLGTSPTARTMIASQIYYRADSRDLLWHFNQEPLPDDSGGQFVWLLRAAAELRAQAGRSSPYRKELLEHYNKVPRTEFYNLVGRYLMGLEDQEAILDAVTSVAQRCEAAYYIAVRTQAEGDFETASDWYRITMETDQVRQGEYAWANDQLSEWYNASKSVALLSSDARKPAAH